MSGAKNYQPTPLAYAGQRQLVTKGRSKLAQLWVRVDADGQPMGPKWDKAHSYLWAGKPIVSGAGIGQVYTVHVDVDSGAVVYGGEKVPTFTGVRVDQALAAEWTATHWADKDCHSLALARRKDASQDQLVAHLAPVTEAYMGATATQRRLMLARIMEILSRGQLPR